MKRPSTIIAAIAAGTLVLVGCSAGSTDYKKAAEKAITSDGGLGKGSTANCEKPDSTEVGTTFECTGTAPDGTVIALTATIDKKDHVVVNSSDAAPEDGTADTTDTTGEDSESTDTTGG